MKSNDVLDVRTRNVSADALDTLRSWARRHGYKHSNADVIRFALDVAIGVVKADGNQTVDQVWQSLTTNKPVATGTVTAVNTAGEINHV